MVWRTREFDHRIEIIKSGKVTNSLASNTYVSDIVFNMLTFVSRKSSVKSVNSVETSEGKSDYYRICKLRLHSIGCRSL